jgi:hypothetical protein
MEYSLVGMFDTAVDSDFFSRPFPNEWGMWLHEMRNNPLVWMRLQRS